MKNRSTEKHIRNVGKRSKRDFDASLKNTRINKFSFQSFRQATASYLEPFTDTILNIFNEKGHKNYHYRNHLELSIP